MEQTHYEKYGRKCYFKNKDKYRPVRQQWAQRNRDKCVQATQRWRAKHPEESAAYQSRFGKSVEGKYRQLFHRHKTRGWTDEFMSLNQYRELFTKPCNYCGKDTRGGIDRVQNEHGYSIGNSVPCCALCNRMKWTLTKYEFIAHLQRVLAHSSTCH